MEEATRKSRASLHVDRRLKNNTLSIRTGIGSKTGEEGRAQRKDRFTILSQCRARFSLELMLGTRGTVLEGFLFLHFQHSLERAQRRTQAFDH